MPRDFPYDESISPSPQPVLDESQTAEITPILLIKFEFDGGNLLIWSGSGPLKFNSETYLGSGDLTTGISGVNENSRISAENVTFSLSGIPSTTIATALDEDYQQRPATLFLGMASGINFSTGIIDAAYVITIFKGKMDTMNIEEGAETSNIALNVENELVALERVNVRHLTLYDQKALYPDDKGFAFVTRVQDTEIEWREHR